MNITKEQKTVLEENDIVLSGDIYDILRALDGKITEIGFNSDYSLNSAGLKLQRLYDELYNQN